MIEKRRLIRCVTARTMRCRPFAMKKVRERKSCCKLLAKEAGEKHIALTDVDRELIIRFLTRDDRLVFFGRPVTGPDEKKKN